MTASERQRRLAQRAERLIRSYGPLRASGSRVEVSCQNHIATLRGIVRSRTLKSIAAALAASVEDIREVRNELACDTDLQVEACRRLAAHPRTRALLPGLTVRVLLGHLDLHGTVPDEKQRQLVEQVAGATPGLLAIHNHLVPVEVAFPLHAPAQAQP